MKLLTTSGRGADQAAAVLCALEMRQQSTTNTVVPVVRRIVSAVRKGGDRALRRYAGQLDGLSPQSPLQIDVAEMQQALDESSPAIRNALRVAADNIRAFARRQLPREWTLSPVPGLATSQMVRPISAVGCYVPSGRHPLPSSLLMTVIPAQVAGVPRVVVASPKPARETLAAAHMLGIRHFYRIGGAQAIAAMAYGTETVARVDKIVGPGNLFVTTAKKLVAFDCAIDMLAGPTEIVVTSENGDPSLIAAELIAQAEHDPDALAILVTTQLSLAQEVLLQVKLQGKKNAAARVSLANNGFVLLAASLHEAHEITNRIAPEHLTIDAPEDLEWLTNAGSVFIGRYSPQAMGDYVSGPNHTLPTGGLARARGGLSVMDFIKVITVQQYDRAALGALAPAAISLAEAEGLIGHADAVRARGVASISPSESRLRQTTRRRRSD